MTNPKSSLYKRRYRRSLALKAGRTPGQTGRPRLPCDDPKRARRRAQYRANAARRHRLGLDQTPTPITEKETK